MKIPFENHFDTLGKVMGTLLKCGIFVGSACVVAYSLRIGRFPQGLTLGDSLLLLMAAICFGTIASLFVYSLVGLGITLSPLVRVFLWLAGKVMPKFARILKEGPYTLAPLSWFAALGALFAIVIIFALAQRDLSMTWNLPLLSITLYFLYSIYTSANSQIIGLSKIVDSPFETSLRADYGTHDKLTKLKTARWAAPLLIVTVPLLLGGATGELLDASMRAAKIRIESPIIYVKRPYSSLMPKALVNPALQAPEGYIAYKGTRILFHGFGMVTVLAFEDGHRRRTLDIPNEYIIVERSRN